MNNEEMVEIGSKVAVDGVIGTLNDITLNGINLHSVTVEVEWDSGPKGRPERNLIRHDKTNELTIINPRCLWSITSDNDRVIRSQYKRNESYQD